MKKRILVVCFSPKRGNSIGLVGALLDSFSDIDRFKYEVDLFDSNYFESNHNPLDYPVDNYYSVPNRFYDKIFKKIPYLRTHISYILIISRFKNILKQKKYDLIVIFHVPPYSNKLVLAAHRAGVQVLMYPWGGDILLPSKIQKKFIQKAFENTDFVGGFPKSNCIISCENDYNVPTSKFRMIKPLIKGVRALELLKGSKSREEMANSVGIDYSKFNIVCGYNGYSTHRQDLIVDAIISNKDVLPRDCQLVFPMTYGRDETYLNRLRMKCEDNDIKCSFLTEYLSDEQVAYLHLVTDLFINIIGSDNGNAFMIEALFANNNIITGKWLHYDQFEQYGIPYHLIESPEDLSRKIYQIFTGRIQKINVPEILIEVYASPEGHKFSSYWTSIIESSNNGI